MKLIVGLGNPENKYKLTRHNIGFLVADQLSHDNNIALQKKISASLTGNGFLFGCRAVLMKPLTYMNLSGEAVSAVSQFYSIAPDDTIVIHDDMDISYGNLKIKTNGGSAGHRGIASIINHLQDDGFIRIRVGIGKPPENILPTDFVLQNFSNNEQQTLKEVIGNVTTCIDVILNQGPDAAMNRFHSQRRTVL